MSKDKNIEEKGYEGPMSTAVRSHSTDREQYVPAGIRGIFASPYVVACAALSAMGGILFGYDQGVVSIILVMDQFLEEFPRVSAAAGGAGFWKGLLTAMIELGALLGAMNQGWIADKYSRKYSIAFAVCIFIVGSVLQVAARDYAMLVVARLIGGVGIGMLSTVAPLYISEISPPEIRGSLLMLEEFAIVSGIVVAFWITFGTRYMAGEWSWRLPFLIQIIPALILGLGILFLPFSPRWLVSKGRDEDALQSLAKLRQLTPDHILVQREWKEIRAEVACYQEILVERHPTLQERTKTNRIKLEIASWLDLFKTGCIKRTIVGAGIMFFSQMAGINALIYYSPTLFEKLGLTYEMQLVMSGVLNIFQLVGVVTTVWSMDRFGRKPLLLWGAFFMFVSHLIVAILVGLFSDNWLAHSAEGWVGVAFLFFYMVSYGATWGPISWAMPSEVFPSSLRAKGVALSACSNWLFNFIVGLITPPLVQNTGWGAYCFFAVFCLLGGIWTWFFVKETNGKTLEEMDAVFGDTATAYDEERLRRIRASIDSSSVVQIH